MLPLCLMLLLLIQTWQDTVCCLVLGENKIQIMNNKKQQDKEVSIPEYLNVTYLYKLLKSTLTYTITIKLLETKTRQYTSTVRSSHWPCTHTLSVLVFDLAFYFLFSSQPRLYCSICRWSEIIKLQFSVVVNKLLSLSIHLSVSCCGKQGEMMYSSVSTTIKIIIDKSIKASVYNPGERARQLARYKNGISSKPLPLPSVLRPMPRPHNLEHASSNWTQRGADRK